MQIFSSARVPKIILRIMKEKCQKIVLGLLIFQYYFNFLVSRNKI